MRPDAVLCVLLLSCPVSGYEQRNTGSIYYFNSPESVKRPGIVGEAFLPCGKPARLFFHFVNKTGHIQPFKLLSDGNWGAGRNGFGLNMEPGKAGIEAARKFLTNNQTPPPGLNVLPGQTISGMIDCLPVTDTHLTCSLGTGPTHWKVETANNPIEVQDTDLGHGTVSLVVGSDTPGAVDGCYGTTVRLQFHNRTAKPMRVKLSVSPRGGALPFLYLYNNTVSMTDSIPARALQPLFITTVPGGGAVVIETIPTGGYNYPVKVLASVLQ